MTESNQLQTHCSLDRWEEPALPGLSSRDMVFVPLDQPIPIAGHLHIHSSFADRLFDTGEGVLPSDPDGKRLAIWIGCCTDTDIPLCAARLVQWALERGLPVIQMPAACATGFLHPERGTGSRRMYHRSAHVKGLVDHPSLAARPTFACRTLIDKIKRLDAVFLCGLTVNRCM